MDQRPLLLIHQGALGDFVVTFPAIILLRGIFGCVDAICQENSGKMACSLGLLEKAYPLESRSWASLYHEKPDALIVDMLRSYEKIVLFSFCPDLEQAIIKASTNEVYRIPPRPQAFQPIHTTDHILQSLLNCGLLSTPRYSMESINLLPVAMTDRRGPGYDVKKVLIHPGSGSRKKNWLVSHFIRLGELLAREGLSPTYILGPAERDLETEIYLEKGPVRECLSLENLPETVGLLRASGGFIGNDSGLAHLAAFIGVPTVAIFGPSSPERWRPLGRAATIVKSPLACSPCFETDPERCTDRACLLSIAPESVKAAFFTVYPT
jgi:hypothetical protein